MYYNTTSIPPQRPGEHNSARIQFTETLLKKMAKDEIKNKTHLAAKAVKRSVARFYKHAPVVSVKTISRVKSRVGMVFDETVDECIDEL